MARAIVTMLVVFFIPVASTAAGEQALDASAADAERWIPHIVAWIKTVLPAFGPS